MTVCKQTEKKHDGFKASAQQPKDQSHCNFNNDYYGDKVCHDPSNQKK